MSDTDPTEGATSGTKRDLESDTNKEGTKEDTAEAITTNGSPSKKPKTDDVDNNANDEVVEHLPIIPGFDLEMDTSRTTLPPSAVGTNDFKEHDVLSGRGGGTNVHPGNRDFRDLINKYRTIYLKAKKNDKPAISRAIVKAVRSKGGRFLKKNEKDNLYYEIGDAQAREKTSQALRQRAPEMRKLMFEQEQLTGGAAPGLPPGVNLGLDMLPPRVDPLAAARTQAVNNNLSEEQLRMAMPVLAANGVHPNFAAGLQAGMQFHHPHLAAAGMGIPGYNPAFYHAMMSGMGLGGGFPGMVTGATAANAGTAAQDVHLGKEVVTKQQDPSSQP
jgi:hypothetical protein